MKMFETVRDCIVSVFCNQYMDRPHGLRIIGNKEDEFSYFLAMDLINVKRGEYVLHILVQALDINSWITSKYIPETIVYFTYNNHTYSALLYKRYEPEVEEAIDNDAPTTEWWIDYNDHGTELIDLRNVTQAEFHSKYCNAMSSAIKTKLKYAEDAKGIFIDFIDISPSLYIG